MIASLFAAARTKRPLAFRDLTTSSKNDNRLGRTLYRQLMRWCRDTDKAIPLSSFLPPVTLNPPHVDKQSLELLARQDSEWQSMLPSNSIVEAHKMTVPILNAEDAANLFRVVFRMNNQNEPSQDVYKQRTSIAFEALRSLNQLTDGLNSLMEHREKHLERDGVLFHVGQVVQHKKERWRGIVTGWHRLTAVQEKLSSLTNKNYDSDIERSVLHLPDEKAVDDDGIRYSIILDSGDAHLFGGRISDHNTFDSKEFVTKQSELKVVQDDSLIRIRSSWTQHQFDRFDPLKRSFVPNTLRAFEYPLDNPDSSENDSPDTMRRDELGGKIVNGVQQFASRLERRILDVSSCSESRGLGLLAQYQQQLSDLADGDVVPTNAFLSAREVSQADLAMYHLRRLLNITFEISELLWIRQISDDSADRIHFSLGEIVQHKKYGFRGVIVAWDPKAAVDVTHWDGLTDIENAGDLPFYSVVPDQNDCIEAFGGERPFRYVCEANLEPCPQERSIIKVDLEPGWVRRVGEPKYDAPDHSRFKYAQDSDLTAECLKAIMDDVIDLQLLIRGPLKTTDTDLADIAERLSLDNLFEMLKLSDTMDGAIVLEETIKEIWKAHKNHTMRLKFENGVADLVRGNKERALTIFLELVEDDPDYAEAWNKLSTCHYMMGDMQSSLETVERTLELLPRHFQAMNGLGLVHYETRRYKLAAQTFRQSLSLDPWSPVSSRLSACLDMLHGMDLEQEQSSPGD